MVARCRSAIRSLVALVCAGGALALDPRPLPGQDQGEQPAKLAPRPTVPAITSGDLMTRLYQFADDSMGGRMTGTVGHLMSTAYLAAEARRLGLVPAGDAGSFFQVLPLVSRRIAAGSSVQVGDQRFEFGVDFGAVIQAVPAGWLPDSAIVIDGGVLDDTLTQVSADQAAGKLVLLAPGRRSGRLPPERYAVRRGARFAGALAVIVPVWDSIPESARRALRTAVVDPPVSASPAGGPPHPPTLLVTRRLWDALREAAAPEGTGARVALDVALRETPVARNVVALLPGSDTLLQREVVVLGAHSDHDGIVPATAPVPAPLSAAIARGERNAPRPRVVRRGPSRSAASPDTIMNGADDDGSGTVALLEIAEALVARPAAPRRSVLFIWHAAEEQGMVGSQWFTSNPTVPLDAIRAMVNLDMVGRGGRRDLEEGGPTYLQVVGARRRSTELGAIVDSVNAARESPFRLDYRLDMSSHPARIFCRSDHASYARFGIPVVFLSTGMHPDYHRPSDEPQHIDYAKLSAVSDYAMALTLALTDRPVPLTLDKKAPDPTADCRH